MCKDFHKHQKNTKYAPSMMQLCGQGDCLENKYTQLILSLGNTVPITTNTGM